MHYSHITGLDKRVSRLAQGTVYLAQSDRDANFALLDEVWAQGCNCFDTAQVYFDGQCERAFGQWLKARGHRKDAVIIGKGAHPNDKLPKRVAPEYITSDLHDSLERMEVDHIDIYLLHRDNPAVPVDEIVDCLNAHKNAGKITVFGGSNWSHTRIAEANAYARANGLQPFTVSSPQMSLARMVKPTWDGCISVGGDDSALTWYAEHDVKLVTWSSLAGGFMAGKFTHENLDSLTDYFDKVTVVAYAYEENFTRLDRARALAEHKGVDLPQLALAYVVKHAVQPLAIVGARNTGEFTQLIAASALALSAEERAWLDLQTDNAPI